MELLIRQIVGRALALAIAFLWWVAGVVYLAMLLTYTILSGRGETGIVKRRPFRISLFSNGPFL